jgi:TPR repeat protein
VLVSTMGFMSWLRSKIGMAEFAAEQRKLLAKWEFAQANDRAIFDADPFTDELMSAIRLHAASPEEGFVQLLDFANRGSLYSTNYVAWSYAVGTGVPKDLDQAQAWYRRAYEGGSDRGLLEYGAYLVSTGQNDEAEKVYEIGWQRGFVPAVYRLIRLRLRPTLPLAERLAWKPSLEWAVEAGHPAARYLLSKYLVRGWFGVPGIPRGMKLVSAHLAATFRGDEDRPIIA